MVEARFEESLLSSPQKKGSPLAREVHALVADLFLAKPAVYYADFLASAVAAWGALFASTAAKGPLALLLLAIAALSLYRAVIFIHELTHLRRGAVPGFRVIFDALVGVPFLAPPLLYLGVHNFHHSPGQYGTRRDPEYWPIGRWPAWKVAFWILQGLLVPLAPFARFLVLAPLSVLDRRLRALVWRRFSSLAINPGFERPPPSAAHRRAFVVEEVACSLWCLALAGLLLSGIFPPRLFATWIAAVAGAGLLNQLRTAVAHRYVSEGAPLSLEEQFLDSVNVPGRAFPTALWAPVGLRYHALHHLMPALPYHALGEAHRRIASAMGPDSRYHCASEKSLAAALARRTPAAP
ncbi:MAG TPA: fatty acid desaturase [Anaeromyxobacteraceae bacterium]|nr:fatty acid desaturase [Anaeromyxobacteraceae bacterium]